MLIRTIEAFLREHALPASNLGRAAVGDPRFVFDLRRGRTPRPGTEQRVRDWMRAYAAGEAG
jgi:hypothetical protein